MTKNSISKIISLIILTTVFSFKSSAQISINLPDDLNRIKNGTTYIMMKDLETDAAKSFIEVYKKYWTLSRIEFVRYEDIVKYISKESCFLSFGGEVRTSSNGGSNTHMYLELWRFSDKFLTTTKKKKFSSADQVQIARIELFPDFATVFDPNEIFKFDYDGDNHLRNWSPGVLKNYIQQLTSLLESGEKRSLYDEVANKTELSKLKDHTLYVPDYILIKFGAFTGSETKKNDEKELFEDYKYEYKLLPMSELSETILSSNEPIYYMIYVKSSTDKFVIVFNSATGEMIYSNYKGISYNFSSKDMKSLCGKIK